MQSPTWRFLPFFVQSIITALANVIMLPARVANSRCSESELVAAYGNFRACYRGRVSITVALARARSDIIKSNPENFKLEL